MAKKDGERRMLFDTRGRRKNVIRVVYAILALLMGASLFLVVGPFNLAELVGGSSSGDAAEVYEEQAERIERRIAAEPQNEQLLASLTRARLGAASGQLEGDPETAERRSMTADARREYRAADESWSRYLKAEDEPSAALAQTVAIGFFTAAEASVTIPDAAEYVELATAAQKVAAERNPNLGTLSTLAIYQNFNGEFAGAERTTERVVEMAASEQEADAVEKQLAELRKNAQQFAKQKKRFAKAQGEAGKAQLENPLGGLSGIGQ